MPIGFKEPILQLKSEGLTHNQIASQLGCSKITVYYHCPKRPKHGQLTPPGAGTSKTRSQIPDNKEDFLPWLLKAGVRHADIAAALGLEQAEICRYAKEQHLDEDHTKQTYREYTLKKRIRRKMLAVAYLGGRCRKCGYKKAISALTFHHTTPGGKDFDISHSPKASWKNVRKELDKCILLCANCHSEEHDSYYVSSQPQGITNRCFGD